MPRIYTSQSDPLDFCRRCFPSEESAKKRYANLGDGPDGRSNCFGYEAEHPDYDDEVIYCQNHRCRKLLTWEDN